MQFYNPQTVLHASEGDPFTRNVRSSGACIDINLLPPSSEGEDELLAKESTPSFIFRISPNTQAAANCLNCASSDLKSGATQLELSYFEREETLNNAALRAISDGKEDAPLIDRKKLRLSKEKSAVLERTFTEHSTITPKQKIALAKQLNLQPRQVEVWFQNRRARTKLKKTVVDCEMLKRYCEALAKENTRLQQEIEELRELMMGGACVIPHAGLYMPTCIMSLRTSAVTARPAMVAPATSTTTSISDLNQPSQSSHQQL